MKLISKKRIRNLTSHSLTPKIAVSVLKPIRHTEIWKWSWEKIFSSYTDHFIYVK